MTKGHPVAITLQEAFHEVFKDVPGVPFYGWTFEYQDSNVAEHFYLQEPQSVEDILGIEKKEGQRMEVSFVEKIVDEGAGLFLEEQRFATPSKDGEQPKCYYSRSQLLVVSKWENARPPKGTQIITYFTNDDGQWWGGILRYPDNTYHTLFGWHMLGPHADIEIPATAGQRTYSNLAQKLTEFYRNLYFEKSEFRAANEVCVDELSIDDMLIISHSGAYDMSPSEFIEDMKQAFKLFIHGLVWEHSFFDPALNKETHDYCMGIYTVEAREKREEYLKRFPLISKLDSAADSLPDIIVPTNDGKD
jgi:hypothetical protein